MSFIETLYTTISDFDTNIKRYGNKDLQTIWNTFGDHTFAINAYFYWIIVYKRIFARPRFDNSINCNRHIFDLFVDFLSINDQDFKQFDFI